MIGFVIWTHTLITARINQKNGTLVGENSASHKRAGKRAFIWIVATAITGVWVYILLFMA